jgi:hypothetical protein
VDKTLLQLQDAIALLASINLLHFLSLGFALFVDRLISKDNLCAGNVTTTDSLRNR